MMQHDSPGPASLAELCQEAVERFGGDWASIRAFVAERIALMPGDDREKLLDDIERLLAFQAPSRPSVLH